MNRMSPYYLLFSLSLFLQQAAAEQFAERADVRQFIREMVEVHEFEGSELRDIFSSAKISNSILRAISRPAEAKPWHEYRRIFLTNSRIRQGARFLAEHRDTLLQAEAVYGVPPEIVVAIIGVETRYGRNAGGYRVIDSLSTLGFEYPKRSAFFLGELKEFLLLAREQKMDPLDVRGSYAGAMGIPQFISSSFRNYAVDFDADGRIDIWENAVDAIGSVGNYFREHGWQPGKPVAVRARVSGEKYLEVLSPGLEPDIHTDQLGEYGISPVQETAGNRRVKLLEYELREGSEFWLGYRNFYVITRYNHSALYAMAVYQLAGEIHRLHKASADG